MWLKAELGRKFALKASVLGGGDKEEQEVKF